MSVGKRADKHQPLTEHDVAERLDRAAMRALRILWEARQLGIAEEVKASRYLTGGTLEWLRAELDAWQVESRVPRTAEQLYREEAERRAAQPAD